MDNGATWYRVSGTDGANGDTWFAEAPKKEGNYYVFTLTDQSTFRVAAYQPFRILTEAEKDGTTTFTNATVTINGATTFYLYIDNDIKYQEIVAQISSVDAVLTRADVSDWTVVKGTEQNTLTVTPGTQPYALLDVSLLLTDGSKLTASRLLEDPGYTDDGQGNYTVTSAEGLKNIAKLVNEQWNLGINITLTADIDLSGIDWTPIGIDYNTVKNVTLKDVKIESNHSSGNVGGVAGWSYGNIENCSVSGSVSSNSTAGGVVGYQWGGSITGCNSSATVKGETYVGGVVGRTNSGATLTACYSTENVTLESNNSDNNYAGGVVGYNGGSNTLTACYATGSVTGSGSGTIYVGGVTGHNSGTLTACYHANGTVSGPAGTTGGVTGRNYKSFNDPVITACYWGSNPDAGIGYNEGGSTTIETTKVTDGDWLDAVAQMSAALQSAGSEWHYELNGALPTLTKQ